MYLLTFIGFLFTHAGRMIRRTLFATQALSYRVIDEETKLTVTSFLIFAVTAMLVMFKLAVVSLAVIWSVRRVFEPRGSRFASAVRPLPAALRPRNSQV